MEDGAIVYNVADFVDEITRFDGTTVDFRYDTDANLAAVIYSNEASHFTYLDNGLLRTASNSVGVISNTYNMANRLTSSKGTASSGTVNYAYYPAGQVSNLTHVAGTTSYALDNADRVSVDWGRTTATY